MFLVRFQDGLSRPVTVYVEPGKEPEWTLPKSGVNILFKAADGRGGDYRRIDSPEGKCVYLASKDGNPAPDDEGLSFDFDIPKDGEYMPFLKIKCESPIGKHDSCFISFDGGEAQQADFAFASESWLWKPVVFSVMKPVPGTKDFYRVSSLGTLNLSKGRHTITLHPREPISVEAILITDNYGSFMNPRGY